MSTTSVLLEVAKERGRQDGKWGGPGHDDKHTTAEFFKYIEDRTTRFTYVNNHDSGAAVKARQLLVEIAALAVAAIESMDRAGGILE